MEEERLISECVEGHETAFQQLVDRYKSYVYKIIYTIVRNEKDAEDITQEAFIKLFYALPKYQGNGFKTWLTRLSVNTAIDFKRKKARELAAVVESQEIMDLSESQLSKESIHPAVKKETQALVRKQINNLPKTYRKVIYSFYILEKSYQEIAIEEKVNVKTIETKLYRARKWMREHWKKGDF